MWVPETEKVSPVLTTVPVEVGEPSPQSIVAVNPVVLGSVPVATTPLNTAPSAAFTAVARSVHTGSLSSRSMNVCVTLTPPV